MVRKEKHMTEVSFREYLDDLKQFAYKHNTESNVKEFTTPLVGDKWSKTIVWEDGAEWHEVSELIWEEVEVYAHGCRVQTHVELYRTEYWSTESGSKFVYQPY